MEFLLTCSQTFPTAFEAARGAIPKREGYVCVVARCVSVAYIPPQRWSRYL